MFDWTPSLNALRAFAAVSRHKSYISAAEELHVTPAAVKQLVRKLEEAVGQKLVERHGRGLAISGAGLAVVEELNSGFSQIDRAVGRMRKHSDRLRLVISVEPSFATAWLVPRLDRFRMRHADIDVLIDSSLKLVDLSRGEADAAIRFGSETLPPLVARRLFAERLCVFCSPSLIQGKDAIRDIKDLGRARLLHWDMSRLTWAISTRKWMAWDAWLRKAGVPPKDWKRGVQFSDYNLAVQAAIAGQGLVLGSLPVLGTLVEAGLLAIPFPETVDPNIGYDLVATPDALRRREVQYFADWIEEEARPAGTPTR